MNPTRLLARHPRRRCAAATSGGVSDATRVAAGRPARVRRIAGADTGARSSKRSTCRRAITSSWSPASRMVQDPVVIDWDADGRLWVVEMVGYMNDIQATGEHNPVGRVVVLEDTNGDGVMDKRTVFADDLVLPRALKVLDHGVLVGEPPNLWLMKDTNGDLKADTKELVTNAYGRLDANVEHNANTLLWAHDNWIYTSEVDLRLRLDHDKFEVQKTLVTRAVGRIAGRRRAGVSEFERVGPPCRTSCRPPYYARNPSLDPHARQRRVPRRRRRRPEHRLARAADARRQSRISGGHPSPGRHAREIHRGVRTDGVSRRSTPDGAVRQRVRGGAGRQPGQPHRRERRWDDACAAGRPTSAASSSPPPTSGSGPSTCRRRPTARCTSSTCIAASCSIADSSPSTCAIRFCRGISNSRSAAGGSTGSFTTRRKRDVTPSLSTASATALVGVLVASQRMVARHGAAPAGRAPGSFGRRAAAGDWRADGRAANADFTRCGRSTALARSSRRTSLRALGDDSRDVRVAGVRLAERVAAQTAMRRSGTAVDATGE